MIHMIRQVLNQWGGKYTIIDSVFEAKKSKPTEHEIDTEFDQIDIDLNNNNSINYDIYDTNRLGVNTSEKDVGEFAKKNDDIIQKRVLGAVINVNKNPDLNLNQLGIKLVDLDTIFISLEKLNVGQRIIVGDKFIPIGYSGYFQSYSATEQSYWEDDVIKSCQVNGNALLPELYDIKYEQGHTLYIVSKINKQVIKKNLIIYIYNLNEEKFEGDIKITGVVT